MRLWPLAILDQLPRQQLLGQHRECCALRGKGWGKKHATVDYVFRHPYSFLFDYHLSVIEEMNNRGYKVAREWYMLDYRGKSMGYDWTVIYDDRPLDANFFRIYPEHDAKYLQECIENLARKGVVIDRRKVA